MVGTYQLQRRDTGSSTHRARVENLRVTARLDEDENPLFTLVDPPLPIGKVDQRGPAGDVVPIEQATELAFDGLQPQGQQFGNLGIRVTLGNQQDDLEFAWGRG